MRTGKNRLGDLLMAKGLVSSDDLAEALLRQGMEPTPLGQILVQSGRLQENDLLRVLAEQRGVPPWNLPKNPPQPEAAAKLSEKFCRENRLIPVKVTASAITVAMADPDCLEAIDQIQAFTKLRVYPVFAHDHHIQSAIASHFGESADASKVQVLVDLAMQEKRLDHIDEVEDDRYEGRPIVQLVDEILLEAVRRLASDIHIEPQKDRIDLRCRVDGQLILMRSMPKALAAPIVSRLKVMAHIDIIEFRTPQDGRFELQLPHGQVDFRLAVLPSLHGPRITLRILDRSQSVRQLDSIGMTADTLHQYREMINRPYGLILVTGPTGSGKTSTLYATLNEVKEFGGNILTCEDPIEYEMDGITQSQVSEKHGLTFAAHIRAALRQDPDVILVGEIRDRETAETAIRAALTGHLVLSTLHANDAPSAIPRLLDLGLDPKLLSAALIGVTAQRLVRVLCECSREEPVDEIKQDLLDYMSAPPIESVRVKVGCPACLGTGYRGRVAMHEVMPVHGRISEYFTVADPVTSLSLAARNFGYISMQERGVELIAAGRTTIEEVMRVMAFDPVSRRQALRIAA